MNKDDSTFSVGYIPLNIKSKAYIFENIFKILKWQKKLCQHLLNADVS